MSCFLQLLLLICQHCVRGKNHVRGGLFTIKTGLQNFSEKNRVREKSALEEDRVRGGPLYIDLLHGIFQGFTYNTFFGAFQ